MYPYILPQSPLYRRPRPFCLILLTPGAVFPRRRAARVFPHGWPRAGSTQFLRIFPHGSRRHSSGAGPAVRRARCTAQYKKYLTKCATQAVPVRVARPIVRVTARQATIAPVIQISPGPPRIDAGASGRHIDGSPVTRCTPLKGDAVPSMPGHAPAYSPLFAPEPQAPHRPTQFAPPVQRFAAPPDRPQTPQLSKRAQAHHATTREPAAGT